MRQTFFTFWLFILFLQIFGSTYVFAAGSQPCEEELEGSPDLVDLLRELAFSKRNCRFHPYGLRPRDLEVGTEVYVDPKAVRNFRGFREDIPNSPVLMRVLAKTGKDGETEIHLRSDKLGDWKVQSYILSHNIYSRPDYGEIAPFEVGEWVRIQGRNELHSLELADGEGDRGRVLSPSMGQFLGVLDDGHYRIRGWFGKVEWVELVVGGFSIPISGHVKYSLQEIKVPKKNVLGFASGTERELLQRLSVFYGISPDFGLGERVRYRDLQGMKVGTFQGEVGEGAYRISLEGKEKILNSDLVYKWVGDFDPTTPDYRPSWASATNSPAGVVLDFLDQGALISSHPDFIGLEFEARIRVLLGYLDLVMPYDKSAEYAGHLIQPAHSILPTLLETGVGNQTYRCLLLAILLSETGYPSQVVRLAGDAKNPEGRVWLEVRRKLENGNGMAYLVEPTRDSLLRADFIEPYWQVQQTAEDSPNGEVARTYLNPKREYVSSDGN